VNDTGTPSLRREAVPECKDPAPDLLEELTGHRFQDPTLLALALTHESYSNERHHGPESNERLEFLGDAVLGLVVCRYLYDRHPDLPEGRLAQIKAHLVSASCLARQARKLGLGEHIRLGRGETLAHGEGRRNILADTLEALIGALYLDGGLAVAGRFVLSLLQDAMDRMEGSQKDFKSLLQECTQRLHKLLPDYEVLREEGPPHERVFVVQVGFLGEILGRGQGRTKREASQNAACEALGTLRRRAGFDLDQVVLLEEPAAGEGPGNPS
jgi:ribonuclease-3